MKSNKSPKRKYLIFAGLIASLVGLTALFPINNNTAKGDIVSAESPSRYVDGEFDIAASLASQFGPAVTEGRTLTTADMTTANPLIPSDIYRPSGTQGPAHEDLATFAWLEFISLVSPMGTYRGETGGSFATSGMQPTETLVWESYQHRAELFPYDPGNNQGRPPAPWDNAPDYKMSYTDVNNNPQSVDFGGHNNYNNLDETTQIGMNILYFPRDAADIDPDSDFEVLFEAKVNQGEWSFANSNYQKFADFDHYFPNGISFPSGTIEVKATWRPLASIATADQHRYHTSSVIYYGGEEDDPEVEVGTYALIGLHIIHKTPNFPTFVFATFEHVDNLNSPSTGATGLYYVPSYDDISYSLPPTDTTSNPTMVVNNPDYPAGWLNAPYAQPNGGAQIPLPVGSPANIAGAQTLQTSVGKVVTVPVTQPATTNTAVGMVNSQAINAMMGIPGFDDNFVWQYYFLKGVQGVPSNDESDPDYYLANIVTESSVPGIQLFTGGQGIARPGGDQGKIGALQIPRNQANTTDVAQGGNTLNQGGCQGCHGIAQTGSGFDFSFLYFSRTSGFSPEVHGLMSAEAEIAQTAKYQAMLNPAKKVKSGVKKKKIRVQPKIDKSK